jgi:hypothetical protein
VANVLLPASTSTSAIVIIRCTIVLALALGKPGRLRKEEEKPAQGPKPGLATRYRKKYRVGLIARRYETSSVGELDLLL